MLRAVMMQHMPKMMKTVETRLLASALLILLLLTACTVADQSCGDGTCADNENLINCPEDCTAIGTDSAPGLRYVSFSGRIETQYNRQRFSRHGGDGLTAFEYSGEYRIGLWFPMAGGPALRQENTLALTELKDLTFGTAVDCEWIPDENSFQPLEFELRASLQIDAGDPSSGAFDLLTYRLVDMPTKLIEGTVRCPKSDGTWSTTNLWDAAAIPQMLSLFARPLETPIYLDTAVTNVIERLAVSPTGEDIPQQVLVWVKDTPQGALTYEIVSDPSTP